MLGRQSDGEKTSTAPTGDLLLSCTEWQQTAEAPQELFNLQSRRTLCRTHCRERERFSHRLPFSCKIPGRHQDESELCSTNTLVLFSLHGELAQTADIIRSKTIFLLNISLFLPPSQADVLCCCSVVYPIRVVRQLQSIWGFLYTL